MKDLEGKVAFITGGGSGVALGQAKVFAEEGMKVVIADVRQDHLDEAMKYFRSKNQAVHPIKLDITDRAAYARARDEVEKVFGQPVQLLCNTAGVSQFGPVEKATYDDWDWQIDVNLKGMINGVQTFMPRMIEYGKGGHIVNTASMSGFVALPSCAIYTTTKYAVRGLSESLRVELGKFNIGVSVLCPGGVNTNIHRSVEARPEKYGSTGYYGADENVFAGLKNAIKDGFDPVDLGKVVRDAVKEDRFWILPYPEFVPVVENNTKEVLEAMNSYREDPDFKRRQELFAKSGRAMPGAAPAKN